MDEINTASLVQQLKEQTNIAVSQEQTLLNTLASDFGHMLSNKASAAALPKSLDEIIDLIHFANKQSLTITLRGLGLSQSGQSIPPDEAITLDLINMPQVFEINREN